MKEKVKVFKRNQSLKATEYNNEKEDSENKCNVYSNDSNSNKKWNSIESNTVNKIYISTSKAKGNIEGENNSKDELKRNIKTLNSEEISVRKESLENGMNSVPLKKNNNDNNSNIKSYENNYNYNANRLSRKSEKTLSMDNRNERINSFRKNSDNININSTNPNNVHFISHSPKYSLDNETSNNIQRNTSNHYSNSNNQKNKLESSPNNDKIKNDNLVKQKSLDSIEINNNSIPRSSIQSNVNINQNINENMAKMIQNQKTINNKKSKNEGTKSIQSIPIFSGFLYKLGRNKRWQWRLFCFDGITLACLSNKNKPKYVIQMSNIKSIRLLHKNAPDYKPNTFVITVENEPVALSPHQENSSMDTYGSTSQDSTLSNSNLAKNTIDNYSKPKRISSMSKNTEYYLRAKTTVDLERWMFVLLTMYKVIKKNVINNESVSNSPRNSTSSSRTRLSQNVVFSSKNSPNSSPLSSPLPSPLPSPSPSPLSPYSNKTSVITNQKSSIDSKSNSENRLSPISPSRNSENNQISSHVNSTTINSNTYINNTNNKNKQTTLERIKIPSLTFSPPLSAMISNYCKEKNDVISAQRYRDTNYRPGYITELNSLNSISISRKDLKINNNERNYSKSYNNIKDIENNSERSIKVKEEIYNNEERRGRNIKNNVNENHIGNRINTNNCESPILQKINTNNCDSPILQQKINTNNCESPILQHNNENIKNSINSNFSSNHNYNGNINIQFKNDIYNTSDIIVSPKYKNNSDLYNNNKRNVNYRNSNIENENSNMSEILEDFLFGNCNDSVVLDDALKEYAFQSLRLFSLAEQKAAAEDVAAAWNMGRDGDKDEVLDVLVQELRKTPLIIENSRNSIMSQSAQILVEEVGQTSFNQSFNNSIQKNMSNNIENNSQDQGINEEDNTFISFAINEDIDEDTSSNSTREDDLSRIKPSYKEKDIPLEKSSNNGNRINVNNNSITQSDKSHLDKSHLDNENNNRVSRHVRFNLDNQTRFIQKAWRTSVAELLNLDNEMNISLEPSIYHGSLLRKNNHLRNFNIERSSSLSHRHRRHKSRDKRKNNTNQSSNISTSKNDEISKIIQPRMVNSTNITTLKHHKAKMVIIDESSDTTDNESDDDDDDDSDDNCPERNDSLKNDLLKVRKGAVNQIRIPKGRPYSYYLAQNKNRNISMKK